MNILIVDDEPYSVNGIASHLDWAELGITDVYKTYSMVGAQKIFEEIAIDILLSDIEMPKGTGIQLVEWVRKKKYKTICLFLTCYSEFDYASRAIQLGIFDYILKPIEYDILTEKISKAAFKVQENKENDLKRLHGEYWDEWRVVRTVKFWDELTNGSVNLRDIPFFIEKQHFISELPARSQLLLIRVLPDKTSEAWEKSLLEYAYKNIMTELFSPLIVSKGQNKYLVIMDSSDYVDEKAFRTHCHISLMALRGALPAEFLAYYDLPCKIEDAIKTYTNLCDDSENNLSVQSTIFKHGSNYQPDKLPKINVEEWSNALVNRNTDIVIDNINDIIFPKGKSHIIDKGTIKLIYYSLIEAIYSTLRLHNLPAHQPFLAKGYDLVGHDFSSVPDFLIWVQYVTEETVVLINTREESQSLINTVQNYIRENFDGDLSRNTIAKLIHLNPDYLSYLFREKSGISLSEFIMDERINAAKKMLLTTELPVHEIAINTGFQSISYFSKQFKRFEKQTPMQFRKKK